MTRKRDTRSLPIGGGRGYARDIDVNQSGNTGSLFAWTGVSGERLKILFARYGTRAEAIATYINGGTDSALESLPDYSFREIAYLVQHEKIVHLDDFAKAIHACHAGTINARNDPRNSRTHLRQHPQLGRRTEKPKRCARLHFGRQARVRL
ncbi:MAG: glycerol-3-phosphate dehydrogenase C-terminal domain-containing protein [Anaerolineales bacterium]